MPPHGALLRLGGDDSMKGNPLSMEQKRLEHAIVQLSSKTADTLESVRKVRSLADQSERLLVDLGQGLEELYQNLPCGGQES